MLKLEASHPVATNAKASLDCFCSSSVECCDDPFFPCLVQARESPHKLIINLLMGQSSGVLCSGQDNHETMLRLAEHLIGSGFGAARFLAHQMTQF